MVDRLHARLHDALLQLAGDEVEPLGGADQVGVGLLGDVLHDLVAGQHELADEQHQLVEQVDVHADGAVGDGAAGLAVRVDRVGVSRRARRRRRPARPRASRRRRPSRPPAPRRRRPARLLDDGTGAATGARPSARPPCVLRGPSSPPGSASRRGPAWRRGPSWPRGPASAAGAFGAATGAACSSGAASRGAGTAAATGAGAGVSSMAALMAATTAETSTGPSPPEASMEVSSDADRVDHLQEHARAGRGQLQLAVAEPGQHVLADVGDLLQAVERQEAAGALDRVDRPEDARQPLARVRLLLQGDEVRVQLVEVLVALDQELLDDVVQTVHRCCLLSHVCDRGQSARLGHRLAAKTTAVLPLIGTRSADATHRRRTGWRPLGRHPARVCAGRVSR